MREETSAAEPRTALEHHVEVAELAPEVFVADVFRLLLRRDPEPAVAEELAARLRAGALSKAALARDLVASVEFQTLQGIDDAVAHVMRLRRDHAADDLVAQAYGLLLRRDPDQPHGDALAEDIRTGAVSAARVVAGIVHSDEFEGLRQLDDGVTRATQDSRREPLRKLRAPAGSGERVVEIPWVLSRYRGEASVLDVGYANADPPYLAALTSLRPGRLVGVDLVHRDVPGLTSVVADVRALPFEDESFDVIVCISTLEHVGYDNEVYGVEAPVDGGAGVVAALRELKRICAPRGRILATVPCGRAESHGWFAQFEAHEWCRTFADAGLVVRERETYVLKPEGWRAGDPRGLAYGERGRGASGLLCVHLEPRRRARRAPA